MTSETECNAVFVMTVRHVDIAERAIDKGKGLPEQRDLIRPRFAFRTLPGGVLTLIVVVTVHELEIGMCPCITRHGHIHAYKIGSDTVAVMCTPFYPS